MIYLLLGHALQLAGVVFMCRLGAKAHCRNGTSSSRMPLLVAGTIVFGLVFACTFCRQIIPFVLTSLVIWLGAMPLAMPASSSSESE